MGVVKVFQLDHVKCVFFQFSVTPPWVQKVEKMHFFLIFVSPKFSFALIKVLNAFSEQNYDILGMSCK
jgi:hypothetical protein